MHAAIVTAFKDPAMLETLVDALIARGMRILIHIDRRTHFASDYLDQLRAKGCIVYQRHKVFWGSYSHLSAIVDLIREAVADPSVTYVHTVSGQDYPIADTKRFGELCDGRILMQYEPLAQTSREVQERFLFYKIFFPLERLRNIPRPFNRAAISVQRLLGIARTRTATYHAIFKGLIWMSLPAHVARYAVTENAPLRFLRELRFTALPEEFFFQTVIVNSDYRSLIDQREVRFTDWGPRDGLRPAVLDLRDLPSLLASDALFARKFDSTVSQALLDQLSTSGTSDYASS